jgi:hypothetical protein
VAAHSPPTVRSAIAVAFSEGGATEVDSPGHRERWVAAHSPTRDSSTVAPPGAPLGAVLLSSSDAAVEESGVTRATGFGRRWTDWVNQATGFPSPGRATPRCGWLRENGAVAGSAFHSARGALSARSAEVEGHLRHRAGSPNSDPEPDRDPETEAGPGPQAAGLGPHFERLEQFGQAAVAQARGQRHRSPKRGAHLEHAQLDMIAAGERPEQLVDRMAAEAWVAALRPNRGAAMHLQPWQRPDVWSLTPAAERARSAPVGRTHRDHHLTAVTPFPGTLSPWHSRPQIPPPPA